MTSLTDGECPLWRCYLLSVLQREKAKDNWHPNPVSSEETQHCKDAWEEWQMQAWYSERQEPAALDWVGLLTSAGMAPHVFRIVCLQSQFLTDSGQMGKAISHDSTPGWTLSLRSAPVSPQCCRHSPTYTDPLTGSSVLHCLWTLFPFPASKSAVLHLGITRRWQLQALFSFHPPRSQLNPKGFTEGDF